MATAGPALPDRHTNPLVYRLGEQEQSVLSVLLANRGRVISRRELSRRAGLANLSERRCAHRDIKPLNLMIARPLWAVEALFDSADDTALSAGAELWLIDHDLAKAYEQPPPREGGASLDLFGELRTGHLTCSAAHLERLSLA